MILLLVLVRANAGHLAVDYLGCCCSVSGSGVMLTSFGPTWSSPASPPDDDQGEIPPDLSPQRLQPGDPRWATALVGSAVLGSRHASPTGKPFAVALAIMLVIALIGLVLARPQSPRQPTQDRRASRFPAWHRRHGHQHPDARRSSGAWVRGDGGRGGLTLFLIGLVLRSTRCR